MTRSRLRWRIDALATNGRPGIAVIRSLLVARENAESVPQSVFETRLLRALKRSGLPMPRTQYEVRDQGRPVAVVDFAYPTAKLAIEADGYRWHSGRASWQRDLARRNALTGLGWQVIHVTWDDLTTHASELLEVIGKIVAERTSR